jgi:hypothetical protein
VQRCPDTIYIVNSQSKLLAALTLLLAVYVSPGSPSVRALLSVAAVLIVFRHDLIGRWRTRSRTQVQDRINELDTREFIRKHQRLSLQRALGGCITLAVGLYIFDVRLSGSTERVLPPLDQGLFLLSILGFNSAVQSFWQTDRNWIKKEQDRLTKRLALLGKAPSF